MFKGGHIRRILVVLWETRLATIARKRGTSYLYVISYIIRIRELLNRKGSNQKILVKPVLQKISIVMETSYLLLMPTPNFLRIRFLIQVVRFMCPNRDWFSTHETVSIGVVMMGNNASCKISGIGMIQIKMFHEVVRIFGNVRHVPHLKRNMISLSILDSK